MGMGFAPTWLRQVSPPPPASQNHFSHWNVLILNYVLPCSDNRLFVSNPVGVDLPRKERHAGGEGAYSGVIVNRGATYKVKPRYSFSILCLEHHYCGDQQWRSLT